MKVEYKIYLELTGNIEIDLDDEDYMVKDLMDVEEIETKYSDAIDEAVNALDLNELEKCEISVIREA